MSAPGSEDHPSFGRALTLLDAGDVDGLGHLLATEPDLVHARSTSVEPPYDGYFHGATLLHHVAGNPIRGALPSNVVAVARVLLDAGADPNAGCGGGPAQPGTEGGTVLELLTSGMQAHVQGLTETLLDALLDGGAELDPDGGMFGTLYHTVEHRGQRDVAVLLHERGVRADLPIASGLGMMDLVDGFFRADGGLSPDAGAIWARTAPGPGAESDEEVLADALLCASVNGRREVAAYLIERGAPLNAFRHWGGFPVTPLHGAAWAGWPDVVQLLLEAGANPALREPTYDGTPASWARHAARTEAADVLRRWQERG